MAGCRGEAPHPVSQDFTFQPVEHLHQHRREHHTATVFTAGLLKRIRQAAALRFRQLTGGSFNSDEWREAPRSLCNALFQGEVTPVSDVHAGTREVRRFRLSGHGHSMVITDLPGVGESRDRDAEYEALYRDILPELDLVLWLIKADDRALSVDEYFWRHILHRGHQQVLFVVTQADKTEPCHEWGKLISPRTSLAFADSSGSFSAVTRELTA